MLNLTVNTREDKEAVLREALAFFGEHGVGLQAHETSAGLTFSSHLGFVQLSFSSDAAGVAVVDIATREFEEQVRTFARQIQ